MVGRLSLPSVPFLDSRLTSIPENQPSGAKGFDSAPKADPSEEKAIQEFEYSLDAVRHRGQPLKQEEEKALVRKIDSHM
jgi:hypothetical protein